MTWCSLHLFFLNLLPSIHSYSTGAKCTTEPDCLGAASIQPAITPSLSAIKKSPVGTSSGPRREIIYKITFYDMLSLTIISTKIMPNPIFCHISAVTLSSFGLHGGLYAKKVYFFYLNSCIFQKKSITFAPDFE